ncbi:MAG: D-tyrosyl-tRNA(Tyr) deacylase [Clostridiaceae bacterium]|nr:D-tyrosyl-tRNA(Tyr) deacylase [Clostridiaceae bacterium]
MGVFGKVLLIFLVAVNGDDAGLLERCADKITKMRIFSDENDKINLSVQDIEGDVLVVSQFTLYADCRKGNRPSFTDALEPKKAEELYESFVELCRQRVNRIETGSFGADMKVSLENDGPFTVLLDSADLEKRKKTE